MKRLLLILIIIFWTFSKSQSQDLVLEQKALNIFLEGGLNEYPKNQKFFLNPKISDDKPFILGAPKCFREYLEKGKLEKVDRPLIEKRLVLNDKSKIKLRSKPKVTRSRCYVEVSQALSVAPNRTFVIMTIHHKSGFNQLFLEFDGNDAFLRHCAKNWDY